MLRTMLSAKIHRATVTHADLNYVGSITVDSQLLQKAGILAGERISVVDVTNGARLETYIIEGDAGSGVIGINGAAAHLVGVGDVVILIAYALFTTEEAHSFQPRIVHVNAENQVLRVDSEPAAALLSGVQTPPHARARQKRQRVRGDKDMTSENASVLDSTTGP